MTMPLRVRAGCAALTMVVLLACRERGNELVSTGPELIVDGTVFRYNGREFRLGRPVETWVDALGPPSRVSEQRSRWTWDDLGLLAWVSSQSPSPSVDELDLTLLAFDDPSVTDDSRLGALKGEPMIERAIDHDLFEPLEKPSSANLIAKYKNAYFDEWQHPKRPFSGRVVLEGAVLKNGWNDLAITLKHMRQVPSSFWYCRRRPLSEIARELLLPHGSGNFYETQGPDFLVDASDGSTIKIDFKTSRTPEGSTCDWRFRDLRFETAVH